MAKKKIVSIKDADKIPLEEAYAAWGTTRESHLAKMKMFIEGKKAGTDMSLAETPVVYCDSRAAVLRPTALKPIVYGKGRKDRGGKGRKS